MTSDLIKITRDEHGRIILTLEVTSVVVAIEPHGWSQILAHPNTRQPCLVFPGVTMPKVG